MGYIVSSRSAWAIQQNIVSKIKFKKNFFKKVIPPRVLCYESYFHDFNKRNSKDILLRKMSKAKENHLGEATI